MLSYPLHILYVDDEEALLDIAKRFLERSGEFVVDTVQSGNEALDLIRAGRFDAVLSDYQMPGMDGIELLIEVRSRHGDLPFILFTGRGREEVVIRAIDNGVDFYLQKGGDPRSQFAELAHKIKRAVEQNRALRALSANEERMRLALDGTREAHWEINLATGESYLSPRGCEMLGYSADEVDPLWGQKWREYTHPDDLDKINAILQEYYTEKSDFFQFEQRLRMRSGGWKWMLVRGKVVEYDDQNHPVRIVGTHTDITEQKKAEEELIAARKDWETIFRATGNPTYILDTSHHVIDANEAVLTMTGKTLDEVKGMTCWSLLHGQESDTIPESCPLESMKVSGKVETGIVEVQAYDRIFLTSCTPVYDDEGKITKAIHIATDITENKRLVHELKENRDYLDQIFSSVKEGIVIIDAKTHEIVDINPAGSGMVGLDREAIIGNTCHRFICSAEEGKCPISDLGQTVDNSERILLTTDGRRIPIIKYVVPFTFQERKYLLETFIDNTERLQAHKDLQTAYEKITEDGETLRKQYEELVDLKNKLLARKAKFKAIVETTPDVIWDLSLDGYFTYVSPRSLDVFGYHPNELMRTSILDLVAPDTLPLAKTLVSQIRTREPGLISLDIPFIHKTGRQITVNIRSNLLFDESDTRIGARCVGRDVTDQIRSMKELVEQKRQIEQLIEQKDLFLNQLAHDLRTPLTPILGMGPLLQEGIVDPDSRELIGIFMNNISYLKKMVDDILVNARLNRMSVPEMFEPYDLSVLIDEAIEANVFLAQQRGLTMKNSVPPDITVMMSKPYAGLVFRNLINNAVKYNSPQGSVIVSSAFENGFVTISVTDTGIGIKPEDMGRIWDELFTGDPSRHDPLSKGFGLSIVRKIIKLHHGTIEAISEGYLKGSTFIVRLPRISTSQPNLPVNLPDEMGKKRF